MTTEGEEIEAELRAILDRPDSEPRLMPRWVTEGLLADMRASNERIRLLFPNDS